MRRLVPGPHRTAPAAPRQPQPPPPLSDEEELSVSVQAHDGHFLERTLRCEGRDLDRAVRLYHHAPIVRQLLSGLLMERPRRGRLAIPLREAGPTPHVILTADGAFVTCLAEGMGISDLPVLPYERFAEAMERADREIAGNRLRQQQLRDLPWAGLIAGIFAGPGHVTREMIEVLDRAPETYHFAVAKVFAHELDFLVRHWRTTGRANYSPRRMEIDSVKAYARLQMCTYLMGFIHTPYVLGLLLPFLPIQSGLEVPLGIAVARHPEGGARILDILEQRRGDQQGQRKVAGYLLQHCLLNPAGSHAVCQRFQQLPIRFDGWEVVRCLTDTLLAQPEELLVERLGHPDPATIPKVVPACGTWLFSNDELLESAFWHPAPSLFFPPAAQVEAVKVAWDENVRAVEEWRGWKATDLQPLRKGPRIGRNQPCPCGSGRKHKQCCLSKPPQGPTQAEKEAAAAVLRELWVKETMERQAKRLAEEPAPAP